MLYPTYEQWLKSQIENQPEIELSNQLPQQISFLDGLSPRESNKKPFTIEKYKNDKRLQKVVEPVFIHSDPERFKILQSFFKDYQQDPKQMFNPLNPHVKKIERFTKQVGRDIHKMRAFVRFKEQIREGIKLYVAYYEPDHFILKKNTEFFVRRFNSMNWLIITPHAWALWNQKQLLYEEERLKKPNLDEDGFEELWKTYYSKIFNPARVKIKAMKNEMPTRFWKNLPEAECIAPLIQSAPTRVSNMVTTQKSHFRKPSFSTLRELNSSIKNCQACNLCQLPTQAVVGEGPKQARLMIVGEAPGDEEEKRGRPFVGPAGKVLRKVLKDLGEDVGNIYLTNAVKHFNYRKSGKLRIHKNPEAQHIMHCHGILQTEIKLQKPQLILGLGRSAAHSLFGFSVSLSNYRGILTKTVDDTPCVISHHPARLLREKDPARREQLTKEFRQDIQLALRTLERTKELVV